VEIKKALGKASSAYSKKTALRATIQVIPYVGGALDTLFSGKDAKIQQQRVETFLSELDERLKKIEGLTDLEPTEELLDLFTSVLDGVVKTRSSAKQKYFASVVSNQVSSARNWEEAETATRLLKDLEEIHIRVLTFSISAPLCDSPFNGLQVVTISEKPHGDEKQQQPTSLAQAFPEYSVDALRMVCSELVSKSLLYDEGVGRLDTKSMEYFVTTDLAEWFINWIIR
jgi:hypothetical protein